MELVESSYIKRWDIQISTCILRSQAIRTILPLEQNKIKFFVYKLSQHVSWYWKMRFSGVLVWKAENWEWSYLRSGCVATSWLAVKCPVSTKSQKKPKLLFKRNVLSHREWQGLAPKAWVLPGTYLQGPPKSLNIISLCHWHFKHCQIC